MSAALRLATRVGVWSATIAACLLVGLPEVPAIVDVGLLAVPCGLAAGVAVFALCSFGHGRRAPASTVAVAAAGGYLTLRSAYEEVLWRGVTLGLLAAYAGGLPALALTTAAFALAHVPAQGRGASVHLLTGASFGGVYLITGSISAAVGAHAAYNLAVLIGMNAEVEARKMVPFGQ